MSVIDIKGLSRVYGFGEAATVALDKADLTVKKGEFIAIMGASGSGKSTLMNMIGLLDTPTSGTYKLSSKDVSHLNEREKARVRREKIGFIFQTFNLLPRMTAVENVALPLMYKGISHVKRLDRAAKLMENVGLGDRQYYMPNQLSGGQIQRVAIARALINKPTIVLADEPTGNLDSKSSDDVMALLKEIHDGGNTIIMVTHNPDITVHCDRIVLMHDGKVVDANAPVPKAKKGAKK